MLTVDANYNPKHVQMILINFHCCLVLTLLMGNGHSTYYLTKFFSFNKSSLTIKIANLWAENMKMIGIGKSCIYDVPSDKMRSNFTEESLKLINKSISKTYI